MNLVENYTPPIPILWFISLDGIKTKEYQNRRQLVLLDFHGVKESKFIGVLTECTRGQQFGEVKLVGGTEELLNVHTDSSSTAINEITEYVTTVYSNKVVVKFK